MPAGTSKRKTCLPHPSPVYLWRKRRLSAKPLGDVAPSWGNPGLYLSTQTPKHRASNSWKNAPGIHFLALSPWSLGAWTNCLLQPRGQAEDISAGSLQSELCPVGPFSTPVWAGPQSKEERWQADRTLDLGFGLFITRLALIFSFRGQTRASPFRVVRP
jgi:hypothetical protein